MGSFFSLWPVYSFHYLTPPSSRKSSMCQSNRTPSCSSQVSQLENSYLRESHLLHHHAQSYSSDPANATSDLRNTERALLPGCTSFTVELHGAPNTTTMAIIYSKKCFPIEVPALIQNFLSPGPSYP